MVSKEIMSGRIFCFGCSFTQYLYPTWADILIEESIARGMPGFNFGRCGAGNMYINMRIWEVNAKYKFTNNDSVFICWSGWNREDRWTNSKGWITPGNILNQTDHKKWFVDEYYDPRFCVMRDCSIISSTQLALKHLNVNALHFSMAPIYQNTDAPTPHSAPMFSEGADVLITYNLKFDAPSMMEYTGCYKVDNMPNRMKRVLPNGTIIQERHPLPDEHLQYVIYNLKDKISWLDNIGPGKDLADTWTQKLAKYDLVTEDLGWRHKTAFNLWQ